MGDFDSNGIRLLQLKRGKGYSLSYCTRSYPNRIHRIINYSDYGFSPKTYLVDGLIIYNAKISDLTTKLGDHSLFFILRETGAKKIATHFFDLGRDVEWLSDSELSENQKRQILNLIL